jgi:hypothetical protein
MQRGRVYDSGAALLTVFLCDAGRSDRVTGEGEM